MHPSWFKFEIGFRFLDDGGCECVVLGNAGYRKFENPVNVSFHDGKQLHSTVGFQMEMKRGMVFAFNYKNEWHLGNLFDEDHDQRWWGSLKPFET